MDWKSERECFGRGATLYKHRRVFAKALKILTIFLINIDNIPWTDIEITYLLL